MAILNLTESSVAPPAPPAAQTPPVAAFARPARRRSAPSATTRSSSCWPSACWSAALVALVTLADRSTGLSPALLSEVVLYALVAVDLTMLGALAFVLARNVIKLLVERRRALPFARFRAKLVAAMLGLALVPAVLVLIVGSELIRNSASRWFAPPIDDVLAAAREIASDYYQDTQVQTSRQAVRLARLLSTAGVERGDVATIRARVSPEVASGRSTLVEVYRIVPDTDPLEVHAAVRRRRADRAARRAARLGRPPRGARRRRQRRHARHRAAGQRRRTGAVGVAGAPARRHGRRSASSSSASTSRAASRSTAAASSRPTRAISSCACCGGRSRASTCRSS